MNGFDATLVMIALFALRCVFPLVLTAGLGYLMNRLVERWEAGPRAADTGAAGRAPGHA